MLRLVVRRVALGILTLWLVSVVVFAATQLLPGNAATAILGRSATPARVAALENQLHLHDSAVVQYGKWIGGILHGDPGKSLATQQPVSTLLSNRIGNSAFLLVVAALVTVPLSLLLGVLAAIRRDRVADHTISTSMLVLAALPEFVIAIALVLLFATTVFKILPAVSLVAPGEEVWSTPKDVVLPAATLVLAVAPYISRIMRGSMIEVLESDYVQMARLKGMSERTVILRHAVPNALVPAIQVSALQVAWMAGGVVVVEYVFGYPGIGSALVDAVGNRDITVVQAVTLLAAAVYVVLNLLADVVSILLTPKLRTALA